MTTCCLCRGFLLAETRTHLRHTVHLLELSSFRRAAWLVVHQQAQLEEQKRQEEKRRVEEEERQRREKLAQEALSRQQRFEQMQKDWQAKAEQEALLGQSILGEVLCSAAGY